MSEHSRRLIGFWGALLAVGATATVARADHAEAIAGRYQVTYAAVTSNCDRAGLQVSRGEMTVTARKASGIEVALDVEGVPTMAGSARKGGRIKASSALTAVRGKDGKFSIAGTIKADGSLASMLFVVEFYDGGKAHCTQTWSMSGARSSSSSRAPAPAPAAPSQR